MRVLLRQLCDHFISGKEIVEHFLQNRGDTSEPRPSSPRKTSRSLPVYPGGEGQLQCPNDVPSFRGLAKFVLRMAAVTAEQPPATRADAEGQGACDILR